MPPARVPREDRPPWLITAPHTGTFFVGDLIEQMRPTWDYRLLAADVSHARKFWAMGTTRQIVVALRDPMLAMISTVNRGEDYTPRVFDALAAGIAARPARLTHLFRVDAPDAERQAELDGLGAFLGLAPPTTNWAPANASPDTFDLKDDYARGIISPRIKAHWDELRTMTATRDLYASRGYSLGWM